MHLWRIRRGGAFRCAQYTLPGCAEPFHLVPHRALEGRTGFATLLVSLEGWVVIDDARRVDDAKNIRHHQIADSEAALEIVLVAEGVGKLLQAQTDELLDLRAAFLRPGGVLVEEDDRAELELCAKVGDGVKGLGGVSWGC